MQKKANPAALLPILEFLLLYLGLGLIFEYVLKIPMGFYSIPIVVVFLIALLVAFCQNRALSFDEKLVLMGKGIGFQKTIGYKLSPKEIDKVFVLKDRELSRRIIRLAAETDSIYFEMAKSVIDYAVENYHMKLKKQMIQAQTDLLAFAAMRIRNGVILQNFYTLDMKKFNPREFQVGEYAVQLMSRKLKVEVPLDEAGNISFHFINAQYDNPSNSQNLIIAHAVSAVLDIVKYTLGLTYNEDSLSYSRYVTHIRLFVQRLVSHNQLPEDTSPLLYDQIAPVCQKEFACVDKIQIYVSEHYQTQITNQERLYLALHIHRILEDQS